MINCQVSSYSQYSFVWVKVNMLSKKKPKYCHVSLRWRIGPLILLRSKEGKLNKYDLEK